MSAVVSTRILRLQAISPRASAAASIAVDVSAIAPAEAMLRYNASEHKMEMWNSYAWVFLKTELVGVYSIITEGFGSFGSKSFVITGGFSSP